MVNWKTVVTAGFAGFLLWGCNLFSTENFESRPNQLNPNTDVFASGLQRTFLWKEGLQAGNRDSSVLPRTILIKNNGDTSLNGIQVLRVHFQAADGYPLPACVVSSLGFNPSQLLFDTVAIPDPGPSLGFPVNPVIGWRNQITSGDLTFVRTLTGLDTLNLSQGLVEAWAFAESTYWNGFPVATATYSMGRTGLLRLYEQRQSFNPNGDTTSGILWREVTAQ